MLFRVQHTADKCSIICFRSYCTQNTCTPVQHRFESVSFRPAAQRCYNACKRDGLSDLFPAYRRGYPKHARRNSNCTWWLPAWKTNCRNLNKIVGGNLAGSPLKQQNVLLKCLGASRVKRKANEIYDAVVSQIHTNIRAAHNVRDASTISQGSCSGL